MAPADMVRRYATGGGEVEPAIAPISPATISVFMATFGGAGILLRNSPIRACW